MPPKALRSATAATAAAPATSTRSRSKNSGTSGAVKSQAPSSKSKRGRAKSGEISKRGRKGKGRKKVVSESEEEEEEDKEDVVMAEGEAESEEEEVEIEEQREGEKEQELVKEMSSEMKRAVIRKKKTKITSVQHLEEDQQNDAAGPPKKLTNAERILENSNISVAPPPHYHECSGTVTPASLIQASAPQDSFNFLFINMDDLFNDDESPSVFSHARQPLQIQEEMDFENQDATETTPCKPVDKQGRSESPESPTMSSTSHSSKFQNFMRQYEYTPEEDMSLDLQGASRITGGHSRQKAAGNNYNIGDNDTMSEIASDAIPTTGTLYIYKDFSAVDPIFSFRKIEIHVHLHKILKYIGQKYKLIQVSNPYIFLWESEEWNLAGQYSELLNDTNQQVEWNLDTNGNTYCKILLDGFGTIQTSNISSIPPGSNEDASTSSTSKLRETTSDQQKLINLFKVPNALCDHTVSNICLSYAKWLFIENIIKQLPSMVSSGKWKDKLPGINIVAPIFIWRGVFTKLHMHPQMNLWLQGNEDISDHEVWKGKTQTQETLKAILLKIEKQQKIAKKNAKETSEDEESSDNMKSKDKGKGKGKGKERVRETTKGKEKEKEKRKDGKRKKNRENLNFINILPVICILSTSPTFNGPSTFRVTGNLNGTRLELDWNLT
ncbi:hypothetical protein BDQ17DRAFT_1474307 [Cyathus striatus]|nr:hypothetical protein BDQ17DRAFT_1474307 [Cyathus striatus]